MDIEQTALTYWHRAIEWWQAWPDGLFYVWLLGGILGFLMWAWFSHRMIRKILGHRRHRGSWYNEVQYAELMQMLHESTQSRVLGFEDMVALRAWKHGDTVKPVFGDEKYGGYL